LDKFNSLLVLPLADTFKDPFPILEALIQAC
jgi:hypothetical protein